MWTPRELADEVIKQGIVNTISLDMWGGWKKPI